MKPDVGLRAFLVREERKSWCSMNKRKQNAGKDLVPHPQSTGKTLVLWNPPSPVAALRFIASVPLYYLAGVVARLDENCPISSHLDPSRPPKPRPNDTRDSQEMEEKFIEELGLTDADLPERFLASKKLAEGDGLALKA